MDTESCQNHNMVIVKMDTVIAIIYNMFFLKLYICFLWWSETSNHEPGGHFNISRCFQLAMLVLATASGLSRQKVSDAELLEMGVGNLLQELGKSSSSFTMDLVEYEL